MTYHSAIATATGIPNQATDELADRRRREIAAAAAETFAEKGYHATGIADIARVLGIGHGTFYRYFENKRDILEYVFEEVMGRIAAAMAGEDPRAATTLAEYRAQAERIGRRLFDLFISDRALARLFFFEALSADIELAGRWQDAQAGLARLGEPYLRNGVERGFLPADLDVAVTARAINGVAFAGALAALGEPDPAAVRDRWIDGSIRLIFAGVGGGAEAA